MTPLVLTHLAATLFMTGLIWFVQVVHYPLFDEVGQDRFRRYHRDHSRLTTYIVLPVMTVEAATAVALVIDRPAFVPRWMVWTGLGLVVVIWLSTALVQVPLHRALSTGPDAGLTRRLVVTNWIRTVAWTVRAALALRIAAGL